MKRNRLDFLFYLIPVFLVANLFVRWKLTNTITTDTKTYMDLANNFPYIMEAKYPSVFPLGYPIFLKTINLFFNDYMISYKVGAFLSLMFSLVFVRVKNFYWREIWVLFTFWSFLRIMPMGWSETLLIPLLIMVFYYNHQFINDKMPSKVFLWLYPLLLFSCILVKYSALFFIIAHFLFSLFLKIIKDRKAWDYFKVAGISSILSALYLLNNYWITGFAMGRRAVPSEEDLNIRLSFSQILFNLNPFFHSRGEYLGISFGWGVSYFFGVLFTLFFSGIILRYFWGNFLKIRTLANVVGGGKMLIFNILNSMIFLMGTIYSYFNTKIDHLNHRLLLGYYIFFFFSVIIALPEFRYRKFTLLLIGLWCCMSICYRMI